VSSSTVGRLPTKRDLTTRSYPVDIDAQGTTDPQMSATQHSSIHRPPAPGRPRGSDTERREGSQARDERMGRAGISSEGLWGQARGLKEADEARRG